MNYFIFNKPVYNLRLGIQAKNYQTYKNNFEIAKNQFMEQFIALKKELSDKEANNAELKKINEEINEEGFQYLC